MPDRKRKKGAASSQLTAQNSTPQVETQPGRESSSESRPSFDLNEADREIVDLHARRQGNDTLTDYKIGRRVGDVLRYVKHGDAEDAVKRIANKIEVGSSSLYSWKKLSDCWPDEDTFVELTQTRNQKGLCLTTAHLVPITRIKDAQRRADAIKHVLENALTSRETTDYVNTIIPAQPRDSHSDVGEAAVGARADNAESRASIAEIHPAVVSPTEVHPEHDGTESATETSPLDALLAEIETDLEPLDEKLHLLNARLGAAYEATPAKERWVPLLAKLLSHMKRCEESLRLLRRNLSREGSEGAAQPEAQ